MLLNNIWTGLRQTVIATLRLYHNIVKTSKRIDCITLHLLRFRQLLLLCMYVCTPHHHFGVSNTFRLIKTPVSVYEIITFSCNHRKIYKLWRLCYSVLSNNFIVVIVFLPLVVTIKVHLFIFYSFRSILNCVSSAVGFSPKTWFIEICQVSFRLIYLFSDFHFVLFIIIILLFFHNTSLTYYNFFIFMYWLLLQR